MIECLLNGRWPLLLPEHRAARTQWTTPPYWEPERLSAMREVISDGTVVYDVGAEEGDFAGLFASWGGFVVAFEPNYKVWPNMRAIWEANGLPPPMTFEGFAGETDRPRWERHLRHGFPPSASGPIISDHAFAQLNERPDLPAVTINTVAATTGYPPDVITIDSEGSELRVLRGAVRVLREDRPEVFVSVHDSFMREQYDDDPAELMALMDHCGYEGRLLAVDHEAHYWFTPR